MAITVPGIVIVDNLSPLIWKELTVSVMDSTPDSAIFLNSYISGSMSRLSLVVLPDTNLLVATSELPQFFALLGMRSDQQKAYISLNVDIINQVSLVVSAVDSTGGSGPTDGEYRVAGNVQINGAPAQRDIVVISDNPGYRAIVGEGESEGDGNFDLTYTGWDGAVVVVALDEYGIAFATTTPLNAGTVVHPTTPNGYVYVVTEAGVTGTAEPAWSVSDVVVSGSVTFAPRAYYRPVASGPLQGELVE